MKHAPISLSIPFENFLSEIRIKNILNNVKVFPVANLKYMNLLDHKAPGKAQNVPN